MKRKRIALSIGHHPTAQGHAYKGMTEYTEGAVIVGYMVNILAREGYLPYIVPTQELRQKIDWINRFDPLFKLAVEIHFNSFHSYAHGTECLHYPGNADAARAARLINNKLVQALGTRDRGIKPRGDLWFLQKPICVPAVIVECFFMPHEYELFFEQQTHYRIAKAVSDGVMEYLKSRGRDK